MLFIKKKFNAQIKIVLKTFSFFYQMDQTLKKALLKYIHSSKLYLIVFIFFLVCFL